MTHNNGLRKKTKLPLQWVDEPGGTVALVPQTMARRQQPNHTILLVPESGALTAQRQPSVAKSCSDPCP